MAVDPAIIENLAEEILADVELSRVKLHVAMLKCSRLARLLGDHENQQRFNYEASGYPSTPDGVPTEAFEMARKVGRVKVIDKLVDKATVRTEQMDTSSVESKSRSRQRKLPSLQPPIVTFRSPRQTRTNSSWHRSVIRKSERNFKTRSPICLEKCLLADRTLTIMQ
jgi:hypothetical protein